MEKIKSIPNLDDVKSALNKWAGLNLRITKIYLFGSYITKTKHPPSDIDIAIEISNKENDTTLGFWCSEGSKLEQELCSLLNYKVDLEWFDAQETPIVKKGLEAGNIVVYQV